MLAVPSCVLVIPLPGSASMRTFSIIFRDTEGQKLVGFLTLYFAYSFILPEEISGVFIAGKKNHFDKKG